MKHKKLYIILFFLFFSVFTVSAHSQQEINSFLKWQNYEQGLDVARYTLGPEGAILHSEVFLLKISPKYFTFDLAIAPQVSQTSQVSQASEFSGVDNIKHFCNVENAIAGINANFFDPKNKPLGVILKNAKLLQNLHRRGNVLTGVFSVDSTGPKIEYRDLFSPEDKLLALQAGPRLIEDGKVLRLSSPEVTSRRSGIAITRKNEVILYATLLRFPGASLTDIQQMLILPELNVKDALNLDGGGSSQFYLDKIGPQSEEVFISGGDDVPVALVIKRKK